MQADIKGAPDCRNILPPSSSTGESVAAGGGSVPVPSGPPSFSVFGIFLHTSVSTAPQRAS